MRIIDQYLSVVDWKAVATLGIPAVVVVLGWFLVHKLNSIRDIASRKREARIEALESAYMRIATASNRPLLDDKAKDDLETFVAEIQLYGTPRQIQIMSGMVEEFKKPNNPVSNDLILADLRDTIRSELNLEPIVGPVWWLRFNRDSSENSTSVVPPPIRAP